MRHTSQPLHQPHHSRPGDIRREELPDRHLSRTESWSDTQDSRWFSTLCQPEETAAGIRNTDTPAVHQQSRTMPVYPTSGYDMMVCEKIAHHLSPAAGEAFACTLLLPHMGEVRMNACQTQQQWQIQLTFFQPSSREYARQHHARFPGIWKPCWKARLS